MKITYCPPWKPWWLNQEEICSCCATTIRLNKIEDANHHLRIYTENPDELIMACPRCFTKIMFKRK